MGNDSAGGSGTSQCLFWATGLGHQSMPFLGLGATYEVPVMQTPQRKLRSCTLKDLAGELFAVCFLYFFF